MGVNTIAVLAGCALFGALAGAVGTFVLARRRALVADVAGHATLPGVALAFLVAQALGLDGRTPWILFLGGAATALVAAALVPPLARLRRVGSDGATALALAGFFGLGGVLLAIVLSNPSGAQGGLRTLLFGNAAAITLGEVGALAIVALAALAALLLLFKALAIVAFDEDFARTAGLPVRTLDLALVLLLVATVVAGMQVAGIVLVVALVITPAAASRLLGGRLSTVARRAALIGALAASLGVVASLLGERIPTGAAMTLAAAALFLAAIPFSRAARAEAA
jgi:manganese/zinc/iron transport system permease protein